MDAGIAAIRELSKQGRYGDALAAAEAVVAAAPDHRDGLYLIACNQRCLNRVSAALRTLGQLEQLHPGFSLLYQERGFCYTTLRDAQHAIQAFHQGVRLDPSMLQSWTMLERLYRMTGEARNAAIAAEQVARILIDRQQYAAALSLLGNSPQADRSLYAAACAGLGEHQRASDTYRELLATAPPRKSTLHLSLGHSLQALGRQQEAIESYHAALAAEPGFGDAYWSLANLKTYRFSPDGRVRMRAAEAAPTTSAVDRYHLCFALGKALEDQGEYAESWSYYLRGNALKHADSHYRPEAIEASARHQMETCTAPLFAASATGAADRDPIFIVGLPRSGSTLVEQILASHSRVEGTQELPTIQHIAHELQGYPQVLRALAPSDFRKLGERYLADTRAYRKSAASRPLFIDKMPNNFRHLGLIHLMLPNATVIDVRREPMACCCSNLQQLFASGQEFTYSMEDVARYYRSYLELMRHWEKVLPHGRVLRVHYEDLVEDVGANVRRILDFCGLEFEPACLEFHRTARSIHTPSSAQVRQPLFRTGLQQWRNYEPWLGPLRDALGDAQTRYRE